MFANVQLEPFRYARRHLVSGLITSLLLASPLVGEVREPAADSVYRHGVVYTADAGDTFAQAIAVFRGRIVYVGSDAGVERMVGPSTRIVDLGGRMLMPGLVDGHLHPVEGGLGLLKCNLGYASLTVEEFQARIKGCLEERAREPQDAWLEVVGWFRYDMRPKGVSVTRATLDALPTPRPIVVHDSFGHTSLVNSRALAMAKVTGATPDPVGGRFDREASGAPTGILEDAAQEAIDTLIPKPTAADNLAAARAAQDALRRQGVTAFLDAVGEPADIEAFAELARTGELTVRAHFAPPIRPAETPDLESARRAVDRVVAIARKYDQGAIRETPSLSVRNVKLFMDGVITAPANTGALLEPYFENHGTAEAPRFEPASRREPDVYFPAPVLREVLVGLARNGIDPHLHTDGDLAVRAALDGVQAMRQSSAGGDVRPALAHCELVDPGDYPRFKALGAIPVLSLQWGKPAADTIEGARDTLGPRRHGLIEPSGLLAAAGARIAFGSDWPVDPLDEWFALQVGVTRAARPGFTPEHAGRLGNDPGLSRNTVLRAITVNAAYELHDDEVVGSLEAGKLADFIVLDRNPATVDDSAIAGTKVLRTVVGGRVVFDDGSLEVGNTGQSRPSAQ
jgi:predicted amidohydrolase YtcJ